MRSRRVRSEPSITRSPARIIAPPMQLRVNRALQAHLAPQTLLQRGGQLLLLCGIERRRGSHRDIDNSLRLVLQTLEQRGDLGQVSQAAVLGERAHEVRAVVAELPARRYR